MLGDEPKCTAPRCVSSDGITKSCLHYHSKKFGQHRITGEYARTQHIRIYRQVLVLYDTKCFDCTQKILVLYNQKTWGLTQFGIQIKHCKCSKQLSYT